MAEIRFNYGDEFIQNTTSSITGGIGIGTSQTSKKLDVEGIISVGSERVSGVASLTSYQGFVNTKLSTTEDLIVEAGKSGSVSGEVVIGTGQTISVSTGATTGQGEIQSLKVYETFMPPVGGTADRPTDVKPGMVYYNKDFKTIEFWDGNFWKQVDNTTTRGRGIFAGGRIGAPSSTVTSSIESIEISTLGDSKSFGDMTNTRRNHGNCSSSTRGLMIAGSYSGSESNNIEYITIASQGNGIDFGDATETDQGESALASSTRGVHATGNPSNKVMDYVEIATLGNAIDFGDRVISLDEHGAVSSATRGLFCGGGAPSGTAPNSTIQLITIASKGDATTFGDLTETRGQLGGGVSNGIRGVVAGGHGSPLIKTRIDYVTIASEGNAIHFGDLSVARGEQAGAASNRIRGVFAGGTNPNASEGTYLTSIESITIATSGNATFFGDLSIPRERIGGGQISDSHGGLGGY